MVRTLHTTKSKKAKATLLRESVRSIKDPALKNMQLRSKIERIGKTSYAAVRELIYKLTKDIVLKSVYIGEYRRCKTIQPRDVAEAGRLMGTPIYGRLK